jgi:hypothetical protein
MAYVTDIREISSPAAQPGFIATLRSTARRFSQTIRDSRQRRAERAVARFLDGNRLTDSLDREISNRLLSGTWGDRV